jgi:hypothetical protein
LASVRRASPDANQARTGSLEPPGQPAAIRPPACGPGAAGTCMPLVHSLSARRTVHAAKLVLPRDIWVHVHNMPPARRVARTIGLGLGA